MSNNEAPKRSTRVSHQGRMLYPKHRPFGDTRYVVLRKHINGHWRQLHYPYKPPVHWGMG